MNKSVESVAKFLFPDDQPNTFVILDGASVPGLPETLHRLQPEHECLFRGELEPDMREVAPYLVRLEPDSEFSDWVIEKGWGKHWGIFALSPADLRTMRQHFRSLLVVYDPEGNPRRFRYYDPRVLSAHLPACNAADLAAMFGPVASYVMEAGVPHSALRFQLTNGSLKQDKLVTS
jgi:hypothetical protein